MHMPAHTCIPYYAWFFSFALFVPAALQLLMQYHLPHCALCHLLYYFLTALPLWFLPPPPSCRAHTCITVLLPTYLLPTWFRAHISYYAAFAHYVSTLPAHAILRTHTPRTPALFLLRLSFSRTLFTAHLPTLLLLLFL